MPHGGGGRRLVQSTNSSEIIKTWGKNIQQRGGFFPALWLTNHGSGNAFIFLLIVSFFYITLTNKLTAAQVIPTESHPIKSYRAMVSFEWICINPHVFLLFLLQDTPLLMQLPLSQPLSWNKQWQWDKIWPHMPPTKPILPSPSPHGATPMEPFNQIPSNPAQAERKRKTISVW